MTRACRRCRPEHKLGIMGMETVDLPDGTTVEERVSLCDPCRQRADLENKAAKKRMAHIFDLPFLEWLFTAPSREEPAR